MAEPMMIRKGESGSSAELITAEQQAQIDWHMREALRQQGCDVPYDQMFVAVHTPAAEAGLSSQRGHTKKSHGPEI
jgi:hypothetical protein